MQHAIYVPNLGDYADARLLAELAGEAEQAGWDGFFVWDHVHPVPRTAGGGDLRAVDPWIALAAVATATERIRIGPLVTPLPRRRPWVVAREAASLDILSGGRLVLGAGLGTPSDFEPFSESADPRLRADRLDEALEIITGLWMGEDVSHAGEHFHVEGARFLPPPVQRPRVPIWLAAVWPNKRPFRRAARWDGVATLAERSPFVTPEQIEEIVAYIKPRRPEGSAFDIVVGGVTKNDTASAAHVAACEAAGATWWLEWITPERGTLKENVERVRSGTPRVS